jgi:hypoxanthine-guanine phosphoribosyltransferase
MIRRGIGRGFLHKKTAYQLLLSLSLVLSASCSFCLLSYLSCSGFENAKKRGTTYGFIRHITEIVNGQDNIIIEDILLRSI